MFLISIFCLLFHLYVSLSFSLHPSEYVTRPSGGNGLLQFWSNLDGFSLWFSVSTFPASISIPRSFEPTLFYPQRPLLYSLLLPARFSTSATTARRDCGARGSRDCHYFWLRPIAAKQPWKWRVYFVNYARKFRAGVASPSTPMHVVSTGLYMTFINLFFFVYHHTYAPPRLKTIHQAPLIVICSLYVVDHW